MIDEAIEVDGIIQRDQQIMKGAEGDILGFRKAKKEKSLKKTVKLGRDGRRNPRNCGNLEIKGKKSVQ